MTTQFKEGDNVTRPEDVYKDGSPIRHGTVLNVRSHTSYIDGQQIFYPEVIEVLWDDDSTVKTYLPHGLTREAS